MGLGGAAAVILAAEREGNKCTGKWDKGKEGRKEKIRCAESCRERDWRNGR